MVRRTLVICFLVAGLAVAAAPAFADSGSMNDPSGDFPDIRKLTYANQDERVVMTMKYSDLELVQNHSFYMRWNTKNYQVFYSPFAGMKELRYQGNKVACGTLRVKELPDTDSVKATIPRSCITKAPNTLKFQGIATAGVSSVDETKVSPNVARG